ncbi:MAG: hypothetical protein LBR08_09680 [Bacteroidales bacterium]|jgi:hypothetical protein|nr:hypothetical protein [Bacteroidales bacterium]
MNRKKAAEEVLIANPIYDGVFKYLMEDNKVARKLISAIIGEEVTELSFAPQEYVSKINIPEKSVSIYRLDFLARIQTSEGTKVVMIEVQKVSFGTDVMRFRHYLGGQYQREENSYKEADNTIHAFPIYCIFFIGDGLGVKGIPVLEVHPSTRDVATGRVLENFRNEFIDSLHHRSWIVQIPELKDRRRNDLEILLSIFDQNNRTENHHILNIHAEDFPEEYRPVIRRLQQAVASKEIREIMLGEDYILEHLRMEERKAQMKLEEVTAEKDGVIAEKDGVIAHEREEKEKIIVEKDGVIAEKDAIIAREREEKEKMIAREREETNKMIVLNSIRAGVPLETIQTITGLSEKEVRKILKNNES